MVSESILYVFLLFNDAGAEVFIGLADDEGVGLADSPEEMSLVMEQVGARFTTLENTAHLHAEVVDAAEVFRVTLCVSGFPFGGYVSTGLEEVQGSVGAIKMFDFGTPSEAGEASFNVVCCHTRSGAKLKAEAK